MKPVSSLRELGGYGLRAPTYCVLGLMLLSAAWAQAGESLLPTVVQGEQASACVSEERLYVRPVELKTGVEQSLCAVGLGDEVKQRRNCLVEALSTSVGFFADKCNMGYFFSLNGVQYDLKKRDPNSGDFLNVEQQIARRRVGKLEFSAGPELLGEFRGDGIQLRVRHVKLLDREVDETALPEDDPILNETYRVQVDISKGKLKRSFPAFLRVDRR